jgi:hypothetical protein
MAFNTAVHESTKATPDTLFLGRGMRCPLGVSWDLSPVNTGDVDGANCDFWSQAYRNLKLAFKKVAHKYNRDRKPHRYGVGDVVRYRLRVVSSKARYVSAKLLLRWSDPMVITKIVRPNVVLLAKPDTSVITRRAHVAQLKHCPK